MAKQVKKAAKPAPKKNPKGRPKSIGTPAEFYKLFCEFRDWAKKNPRIENIFSQKLGASVKVEREQPLTWAGFDAWLYDSGIIQDSEDYRSNTGGRYDDFKGVVTRVNKVMYQDKFTGAAVGIYNANLIARDLGIADKQDIKGTNTNVNYNMDPLTPEKIKQINEALENDY